MDEADWHRIEEVELLPAAPPGHDQAGVLELPQVLHDAEARHREPLLQRAERLPVRPEELIEQLAPGRVGQGLEHLVHDPENR